MALCENPLLSAMRTPRCRRGLKTLWSYPPNFVALGSRRVCGTKRVDLKPAGGQKYISWTAQRAGLICGTHLSMLFTKLFSQRLSSYQLSRYLAPGPRRRAGTRDTRGAGSKISFP
eukprot:2843404-Rhodomonas_salina.1